MVVQRSVALSKQSISPDHKPPHTFRILRSGLKLDLRCGQGQGNDWPGANCAPISLKNRKSGAEQACLIWFRSLPRFTAAQHVCHTTITDSMQTSVRKRIRLRLTELHLFLILRIQRHSNNAFSNKIQLSTWRVKAEDSCSRADTFTSAVSQLQFVQVLKGALTHEFQSIINIQHNLTCGAQPLHACTQSNRIV